MTWNGTPGRIQKDQNFKKVKLHNMFWQQTQWITIGNYCKLGYLHNMQF